MVYYVSDDHNRDIEYTTQLCEAKRIGETFSKNYKTRCIIEVYYGNKHGDGGSLKYRLQYNLVKNKWLKIT